MIVSAKIYTHVLVSVLYSALFETLKYLALLILNPSSPATRNFMQHYMIRISNLGQQLSILILQHMTLQKYLL